MRPIGTALVYSPEITEQPSAVVNLSVSSVSLVSQPCSDDDIPRRHRDTRVGKGFLQYVRIPHEIRAPWNRAVRSFCVGCVVTESERPSDERWRGATSTDALEPLAITSLPLSSRRVALLRAPTVCCHFISATSLRSWATASCVCANLRAVRHRATPLR